MVRTREKRNTYRVLAEIPERDHLEDLNMEEKIILKMDLT